ncbi:MAG TPA: HAMP domain-containing sensor histidine kinase [Gemmatimonadaceae bacterium]|nr:HAMP domain-containing sensor histidine kinase [Gemmatimonadaceae bacterium]
MRSRAPRATATAREPERVERSSGGSGAMRAVPPVVTLAVPDLRIAKALREALRRAADRVAAAPAAVEQGTHADDLRFQLEALQAAISQAAAGETPLLERAAPAVPVQKVLNLLRASLVAELSSVRESVPAGDIISLMSAIEDVQLALDRDEAHRFASRLSGAGGLELIVEVAHDLRSPLASILFLAETLRKAQSGVVNPVQERQLGLIYSAAFGLSAMASDVIELARGGDRLVDTALVPFSVADLMRSVRDIVLPMAEEKGLTVRLTTPDADFRLGHPGALNRVLLNLTTNALKFTSEGHVELTAKQLSRTRLAFSVQDTGRGIPPEVMSCLFETFRRRRNAGEYTFSSAGLGLSICRKLVAAMGGALQVDTGAAAGTRFSFELDLAIAPRL